MYSEKVMDHFQHPRNVGEIENASGVGTVGNAKCGDIMRMFLDIDDKTHIIKECKFKTFGCGAAVATSSMARKQCRLPTKPLWKLWTDFRRSKYTAHFLQKKQSMLHCGIMHRNMES